jgi:hypothetical protein
MSERRLLPVTALGLKKSEVPMPLGAHQALSLDSEEDVRQLFRDLRIAITDVSRFCAAIGQLRIERESGTSPPEQASTDFSSTLKKLQDKKVVLEYETNLRTPQGSQRVGAHVKELFDTIQKTVDTAMTSEPSLNFLIGRVEDQLVVQGRKNSLSVVWEEQAPDSLKRIVLYVIELDGRLPLQTEHFATDPTTEKRRTVNYALSFNQANQLGWMEEKTHRFLSASAFAEYWISELIRLSYSLG